MLFFQSCNFCILSDIFKILPKSYLKSFENMLFQLRKIALCCFQKPVHIEDESFRFPQITENNLKILHSVNFRFHNRGKIRADSINFFIHIKRKNIVSNKILSAIIGQCFH